MLRQPVSVLSWTVLCLCGTVRSVAFAADPLDTVTITASPIGAGDSLATLVESLDRDTLLQSGGASLGDVLARVPGVTGSGFAPGASRPIIRGYDSSRVRVLENGLGSFDVADVGPDHGVPIDPLGADRIEILRGPGTLRFGSQAIGGVVNTLNQRVPTRLPTDSLGGEVTLGASSAADGREGSGQLNAAVGDFALHADGFRRRLEDYDSPAGTEAGTFWNGKGASLGGSRLFPQGYAGVAVVHYDANYGLPGEDAFIGMRQDKVLTRAAYEPDGSTLARLTLDAGFGDYRHAERDADGAEHAVFENSEWEGRFEATFGAIGFLSAAALGAQVQHRDYSALGEAADYLLPARTRSTAAFAFGESEVNARTRLQYGLRVERTEVSGIDAQDTRRQPRFTPISASFGTVFDAAPGLQLGLTAASSGRAPAQTELFARGPHDGPQTYERGDADLGIERSNSLEATLHWRREGTHVEAAVWHSWHRRFIHGDFTGRDCDDAGNCADGSRDELRELRYDASDARFRGLEFEWEQRIARLGAGTISARLSGDVVRANFTDGDDVPRIPPWRVGIGLDYETKAFHIAADVRHAGDQDRPGLLDTPTPGYTSLDLAATWQAPSPKPLSITLTGRNLGNSRQRNAASFNKDTLLMPGRDIRLLARLQF